MFTKTKLVLFLLTEIYKAVKDAEKQNEIERIRENPHDWMSNHFARVRDDSDKTS